MKRALITGIAGQDGSYLSELLISKGYDVHGILRRVAVDDPQRLWRIAGVLDKLTLHSGSLESYASILNIVDRVQPDELYHLAAQCFVAASFEDPHSTFDTNANGTLNVLSAVKERSPKTRVYFAATSEMYGNATEAPQDEYTPFAPRSPYGTSKLAGYHLVRNYREAYGIFACSGICFNHESPRRGLEFVTRKITRASARIKAGLDDKLVLGNLDAKRDWGFAGDYVRAMWLMLQRDLPEDYVIATGKTHSVGEFVKLAFERVDLDWKKHVVVDEKFRRPAEIDLLLGDASRAEQQLNWAPTIAFEKLVEIMTDAEVIP